MGSVPIMLISGAPDPGPIPPSDAPHANAWYDGRDFDGYRITEAPLYTRRPLRVVCVGAGAAGLQLAYKASRGGSAPSTSSSSSSSSSSLLDRGVDLCIYERAGDVGGTWRENRYPGCTCDIPSHSYQFAWARNPAWSAYYSPSAEIWRYLKDVAAAHDLERHVRFHTTVTRADWDEDAGQWRLALLDRSETAGEGEGVAREDRCDILVSATGILNAWRYPDIPGLDAFGGKLMHSARWDESFHFDETTRVAVIGGGSSAVQIIPALQPQVGRLTAFLRSPVWVTTGFGAKHAGPGGTNFKYSEEQKKAWAEDPELFDKASLSSSLFSALPYRDLAIERPTPYTHIYTFMD